MIPRDQGVLGENRMGLGAAQVDPLRAGLDPRDPTAPAMLRGPAQAAPVGPSVAEVVASPARRAERVWRPATDPRRDWKRNVFIQLRMSGP